MRIKFYQKNIGTSNLFCILCFIFAANFLFAESFFAAVTSPEVIMPAQIYSTIAPADESSNPHAWTEVAEGLVAHAGGAVDVYFGTNSLEAITQNYAAGQRVFEIDFNLTDDGKLAAVHDWNGYPNHRSSELWKTVKIKDRYTPLFAEDVLSLMALYPDIYLITDTKSYSLDEEEITKQFKELLYAAIFEDPDLIQRIVPQVYDQDMYHLIMEIYPFESVIYTLYASPDTDAQVLEFVSEHEQIKVVTMAPSRYSDGFAQGLAEKGKYIYMFTLNSAEEVKAWREKGVHGFYTDTLRPAATDSDRPSA